MFGLVKNYGYLVKKAGLYDQGNHAALELIKGENAPCQVESKENLPGITTAMAELPYINPKYFSYPGIYRIHLYCSNSQPSFSMNFSLIMSFT